MGDGSPAPSRSNQDPLPAGRGVNPGLQQTPEKLERALARSVLFTHGPRKPVDRDASGLSSLSECRSLEDLLLLLERDAIDSLVFDESILEHERAHVSGWARIFKPTLTCESHASFLRRLFGAGHVA